MRKLIIILVLFVFTFATYASSDSIPKLLGVKEKLILFSDRSLYIAGEKMLLTGKLQPIDTACNFLSNIVYVEIINSQMQVLSKQKYFTKENILHAEIKIPNDFKSGYYLLRSYTNFMRNFGVNSYSEQYFRVINPKQTLDVNPTAISEIQIMSINRVDELNARLMIKLPLNKAIKDIKVVNEEESQVHDFFVWPNSYFAYSDYSFHAKEKYYLKIINSEGRIDKRLIESNLNGKKSIIYSLFDKYLVVSVLSEFGAILEDENNELFVYSIENNTKVLKKRLRSNGLKTYSLSLSDFSQGLHLLLIKNINNENVAGTFVYRPFTVSAPIGLDLNHQSYQQYQNIQVDIELFDQIDILDIAVVKKGTFDDISTIPDVFFYNKNALLHYLENTQLSSDSIVIQYNKLLQTIDALQFVSLFAEKETTIPISFLPESNHQILNGVLINNANGKPLPNENVYLSVFGESMDFQIFRTNVNGEFYFRLKDLKLEQNLFLAAQNQVSFSSHAKPEMEFDKRLSSWHAPYMYYTKNDATFLNELYVNAQISQVEIAHAFRPSHKSLFFIRDTTLFDSDVFLKDYISLSTLKDVFREIVPSLSIGGGRQQSNLQLYDAERGIYKDNIIVFVDNVPVTNFDYLFKLSPELIERISVLNKAYYIGNYLVDGIVFITSKSGILGLKEFSSPQSIFKYQGALPLIENTELPINQIAIQNAPIFLNTLYSSTFIPKGEKKIKLSFNAGAHISDYTIQCRVLSKSGKVYYRNIDFFVTK